MYLSSPILPYSVESSSVRWGCKGGIGYYWPLQQPKVYNAGSEWWWFRKFCTSLSPRISRLSATWKANGSITPSEVSQKHLWGWLSYPSTKAVELLKEAEWMGFGGQQLQTSEKFVSSGNILIAISLRNAKPNLNGQRYLKPCTLHVLKPHQGRSKSSGDVTVFTGRVASKRGTLTLYVGI